MFSLKNKKKKKKKTSHNLDTLLSYNYEVFVLGQVEVSYLSTEKRDKLDKSGMVFPQSCLWWMDTLDKYCKGGQLLHQEIAFLIFKKKNFQNDLFS